MRTAGASGVVQPRLEGAALLIQETLARLGLPLARADAYLDRFREAIGLATRQCPPGSDVLPMVDEVQLSALGALADQSLREARVREQFGVLILGVRRTDGTGVVTPSPETRLRPGDRLRVFGLPTQLAAFAEATGGATDGVDTGHCESRKGNGVKQ